MGFWSKLGKGLGVAGSVVGAPFTGGASLAALPGILGAAGSVASAISGGRAAGRESEAQQQGQHDLLRLQGERFNYEAPQMRARNSVRGDLLANLQPVQITGPITGTKGKMPTITGGLNPALLSDNSRQLGQAMSRDALLSQMQGPAFTPTAMPKPNAFDKTLNIMGGVGLGAGMLDLFRKPKAPPQPTGYTQPISPRVGVRF